MNILFETQEQRDTKAAHRSIESCLETGNFDNARTLLVEFEAMYPDSGKNLRAALVRDYGTML